MTIIPTDLLFINQCNPNDHYIIFPFIFLHILYYTRDTWILKQMLNLLAPLLLSVFSSLHSLLCLDIGVEEDRYETGGHIEIRIWSSGPHCMKYLVLNASSFCLSHSKYLHVKSSMQFLARKLSETVNAPITFGKRTQYTYPQF